MLSHVPAKFIFFTNGLPSVLVLLLRISALSIWAQGAVRQNPGVPIVAVSHDRSLESFGDHTAPTLSSLKRSVFRITVYRKVFRWSRPFDDHYVVGSLGSGFLVGDSPLTICTCAHVVRGADLVYVQVTDFGKTRFEALVDTVNHYADVAFITLKQPDDLLKKLGDANVKLAPLRFAEKTPPLGHSVMAPGFPLGQETMTLSTGVLSGVDHVSFHYTNLAIQSTAIISSGNSGSPLLDADTLEVIGMNYAKNTGEAQINYVVGLWRLKQVLLKHKQEHGEGKPSGTYQMRLVEPGLVTSPGVDALYLLSQSSKTCDSGPLIAVVQPNSPFKDAEPPIPHNSFLVSIDGVKLDRYGQGAKKEYVDEMVDFGDLMWMRGGTGEEDIAFETCNAVSGQIQKHKMSMAWRKDREGKGVQYVYDPRLDKLDWEIFGDLIFMPLTENHISLFAGDFHYSAMARFLAPEERQKPRLIVMLLKGGGEAADALDLTRGSDLEVISSINGHDVQSLEDYRTHFFPDPQKKQDSQKPSGIKLLSANASRTWPQGIDAQSSRLLGSQSFLRREHQTIRKGEELVWSLKTASGKEYASLFVQTLKSQATQYARGMSYVATPAAKDAMTQLGFFAEAKKQSLLVTPLDRTVSELNIDTATQLTGEPLEAVRREDGIEILEYAHTESYDEW